MNFTTFAGSFQSKVLSKDYDDYLLFEERRKDALEKYPDHIAEIQYFSTRDPSSTNEYLLWLMEQHTNTSSNSVAKASLVSEVKKYHGFKSDMQEKDIHNYDFKKLNEAITEHERVQSREERERRATATKEPLEEVEAKSARLYQITLKMSVDRAVGYGIESALNRIRAIEGVTIVANDSTDSYLGKNIILARIKFHPLSDSMRPETYVRQILMPKIDSSIVVPGVKVIEMVRKTLIRLV